MPVPGELRMFSFSFAPQGWLSCQGQSLAASQYATLFAAIGQTFGGSGQAPNQTFNLPDLRGRVMMGVKPGLHDLGMGGTESTVLKTNNVPQHTHTFNMANEATGPTADGASIAQTVMTTQGADSDFMSFTPESFLTPLNKDTLAVTGSGTAHENRMPSVGVNICIAAHNNLNSSVFGEIRLSASTYIPSGWMACQGQLLSINQYAALFSLIGTAYGGDGINTFALPNICGRTAVNAGQGEGLSNYALGETFGSETVTLTSNEMPAHNHTLMADSNVGVTNDAAGNYMCERDSSVSGVIKSYLVPPDNIPMVTLGAETIGNTPSVTQAHENRQPYVTVCYIISVDYGVYPQRS